MTTSPTTPEPVPPKPLQHSEAPNNNWLETFYKECGREATLAYTTLNQMKNWAMIVAAAAISGLAFGAKSADYPAPVMFAGAVIVYVFVLRFYIRAILCYINLVRWNVLQSDCIQLNLMPKRGSSTQNEPELRKKLEDDLQNYYFAWLSPIPRKEQLYQNLKLGFYLLFALSLFFVVWGAVSLWVNSALVRGLTVFAVLDTVLEFNDFAKSKYFDDVSAWERRQKRGKLYEIFPIPASRGAFLLGWVATLSISLIVAGWSSVKAAVITAICGLR